MRNHIDKEVEVKTDYWNGNKGMEVEFSKLIREKSGKHFKQMQQVITGFKP
ncbi:MAG: hypothetical protein R6V72_12465 [Cyclobacterium sp.]|uniref:hypothetical protein n=1 Tax=Cyclobacterium sp. TaxID=1966343 RepID=UPI0039707043